MVQITEWEQDILKALDAYLKEHEGEELPTLTDLANYTGERTRKISPASKKLEERGLINREQEQKHWRKRLSFTPEGERVLSALKEIESATGENDE